MRQPNSWRGKRNERYDAHKRKPGAARFWKQLTNRKGRRWSNRIRWAQVRDVIEH